MRCSIAILSLVGTFSASAASGQSDTLPTRSSSGAFVAGVLGTALPVAIGGVLWVLGGSDCNVGAGCPGPDRTTPALLMASGFVLGPSLGYALAGRGGHAAGWAVIRASLVLVSIIPAYGICGWDCTQGDSAYDIAWLVIASGAGLSAALAIHDLVGLHRLGSAPRRSVAVLPYYDGHATGILVHFSF